MIRLEVVRVGLKELRANVMRTVLTMLGVVFGVASVIAMVSIAEGARYEAVREVEAMGARSIRVRAVKLSGADLARSRQLGVDGLTVEDAAALRALPVVEGASPLLVRDVEVTRGGRTAAVRVVGTWPEHAGVAGLAVARGRFLTDADESQAAPVVVLGARAAQELLPFRDALGDSLTVAGIDCVVVGVLEDRRSATSRVAAMSAEDVGRDVYLPASTARFRLPRGKGEPEVAEMAVRARAGDGVRVVAGLVSDALSRRHLGLSDFEVIVPEELLRQAQASQRIFNLVMGAIASISLVVGGIGIMNVMLVTVVQRTREIGIRRAVGATRADIRAQFLAEAVVIAALGGLAGVILGASLAAGIATWAGWVTIVSPVAVLVAFSVAGATGIAFGLLPAVKASRVDPIDCLRHE